MFVRRAITFMPDWGATVVLAPLTLVSEPVAVAAVIGAGMIAAGYVALVVAQPLVARLQPPATDPAASPGNAR